MKQPFITVKTTIKKVSNSSYGIIIPKAYIDNALLTPNENYVITFQLTTTLTGSGKEGWGVRQGQPLKISDLRDSVQGIPVLRALPTTSHTTNPMTKHKKKSIQ